MIPNLVARYAARVHASIGDGHHVASPLGAWLLLALIGPLADEADRAAIEDVLGCPVATARSLAEGLLANPHDAVGSALAAWADGARLGDRVNTWLDGLPARTDHGSIPSQDEADRWARDHTLGLIERFPITLDPETILVLASALATKVTWQLPFALRPSSELGGMFTGSIEHVLYTASSREVELADTTAAGRVAVVTKQADGLQVRAVLGDPDAPPTTMLAAAHELIEAYVVPGHVSLFDVDLGTGPLGTVTERTYTSIAMSDRTETAAAWLPAWAAESEHDLTADARLGFGVASAIVNRSLPPMAEGYAFEARQSAMARFTRLGFEAAAVTAFAARAGAMMMDERTVTERHLDVRVDRPFAVVATAVARHADGTPDPWGDVPVFSAWVTEAIEPPD